MKNQKKRIDGITLIALVVTIILLLIISAISISTLTGQNGILSRAEESREQTKIAEYKEELEMIRPGLEVDKNIENLTTKELMDRYEKEIRNNTKFQKEGTQIIRRDDATIRVITEEGYVFDVTMEGVEYKGKQGESELPDLEEGDIKFNITPSGWTNGKVEVEITTKYEYILEYSLDDGSTWTKYTEKLTFDKNQGIIVRGKTELDEIKGYGTLNIDNIDRLKPNSFIVGIEGVTTNSITVKGETTDKEATNEDGKSGIKEYYFSKDNGNTWESNENKLGTTYTFTSLTQGQSYNIKMKAIDNAENEIITQSIARTTGEVPGGNATITYSYSPSGWTNGNVVVTIKSKESNYDIEYSTNGSTWNKYTNGVTMTNNGTVYARLKDSTGQIGAVATGNVTNIERTGPTISSLTTSEITTSSIKLTVKASDSQSGIAKYEYYNGNKLVGSTTSNVCVVSNLTNATSYTLKVVVTDKAGNASNKSVSATTLTAVASIGNNTYTTLQAAVNAVSANGTKTTITMIRNTTENITIPSGKNIVLNTNGKTISYSGVDTVVNYGTLEVVGTGTITSTDVWAIGNFGTFTLTSSTITANHEHAAMGTRDGVVYIKGGTIKNTGTGPGLSNLDNGKTYVQGGLIENNTSSISTLRNQAILYVSAGTIRNLGGGWSIYTEPGGLCSYTGGSVSSPYKLSG